MADTITLVFSSFCSNEDAAIKQDRVDKEYDRLRKIGLQSENVALMVRMLGILSVSSKSFVISRYQFSISRSVQEINIEFQFTPR